MTNDHKSSMMTFSQYQEEVDPGTYVAAIPSSDSARALQLWLNAGIVSEDVKQAPDFHCTLVYSKVTIPSAASINGMSIYSQATPLSLDNFNDNLVLRLDFPAGRRLNLTFRRAGAVEDYPEYKPHITLISGFREWREGGGNADKLDISYAPKTIYFDKLLTSTLAQ